MHKTNTFAVWWLPFLCMTVLFSAHLSIGANTNALSLIFAVASYGLCLLCLVFSPKVGQAMAPYGTKAVVLLFALLLLFTGLQLVPFASGYTHPFWAWVDAPNIIALDRDAARIELVKLGALGTFFIVGLAIGLQDKRAELLFKLLIIAGGIFALWAFIDYLSVARAAPNGYVQSYRRLEAGFGSANSAATLFGVLSVLSLTFIIRTAKSVASKTSNRMVFVEQLIKRSPLPITSLLFTLTSLLLTASRAGISASVVAILVLIGWELVRSTGNKSGSVKVSGVALLALSIIALVFFMSSGLFIDRLNQTAAGSATRAQMLAAHWQAFKIAPWMGYGLGSFYLVNDTLMNAQTWRALHDLGSMHNVYLQWLEEAGIIGTTLMFSALALIIWQIWRGLRIRRRMHTWLRAILCISLLVLLHGMVDYGLQVPSIAMTWALLLGIGVGLATKRQH